MDKAGFVGSRPIWGGFQLRSTVRLCCAHIIEVDGFEPPVTFRGLLTIRSCVRTGTSVNVVFHKYECSTMRVLLSRPCRGQRISTHPSPSEHVWRQKKGNKQILYTFILIQILTSDLYVLFRGSLEWFKLTFDFTSSLYVRPALKVKQEHFRQQNGI